MKPREILEMMREARGPTTRPMAPGSRWIDLRTVYHELNRDGYGDKPRTAAAFLDVASISDPADAAFLIKWFDAYLVYRLTRK